MRDREDVQVLFLQLPNTIKEFVTANPDMSYTVVLNANLSYEARLEAYAHALNHIQDGDFEKLCSADLIELSSHQ